MKETRKLVRKPRAAAVAKSAAKPAGKTAAKSAAAPAPAKGKAVVRKKSAATLPRATVPKPDDNREERVRVVAYLRAERRGFVPGHELEDWFAAEAEVSAVTSPRSS
jgi:hypothetical protein